MPTAGPRYSLDEFRRRGNEIYERDIKPQLKPEDKGKFCAIDIETGAFEIDADRMAATKRLWKKLPDPQPWVVRIGYPSDLKFGYRTTMQFRASQLSKRA